jgi:small subunit ribosomal protein S6e
MVEFKTVISDPKSGKAYQIEVKGHHANSFLGKKIGDDVDGIFVGLPGYKLVITGGSDKDGFPMRKDIPTPKRLRILTSKSIGFNPRMRGVRKRITVRGNMISPEIVQINMKIKTFGPKPIEDFMSKK